ncbi:MAG: UDP-glucose/GDP-mannose dehydrogenase family protein [Salinibacterium sp.]|nr:MAG: UDP-glucose/GDP-mannose dehydrogenase family protein [Salinibacterium sp.]
MSSIGVIGRGHVGHHVIRQLSAHFAVVSYDLHDDGEYPLEALAACDFALICVDTPSLPDGSVDVSRVEAAISQIPCDLVVIRSTVPPGTTARLAKSTGKNVLFWPEYVGETQFSASSWERFSATQPFIVLGGESEARKKVIDLLLPLYGPEVRVLQCSSDEAELVKYMENSYFAAKVIFVNEFRDLSEKLGMNWHTVREGWLLDPRVERDHTVAFAEDRGFSGKCLPKDLAGILHVARQSGVPMTMLTAVQEANLAYRSER